MNKKYPWLPIDERLIPDIFSFKYPKSWWVRVALFVEMLLAVIAVIGTLLLALLPRSPLPSEEIHATTSTSSSPTP